MADRRAHILLASRGYFTIIIIRKRKGKERKPYSALFDCRNSLFNKFFFTFCILPPYFGIITVQKASNICVSLLLKSVNKFVSLLYNKKRKVATF